MYININDVLRMFIEGDGHDEFTEGYNFAVNEYREKIKAMSEGKRGEQKMHDTLIPHLLNYMERNNFAWGLYVALLYVVESKHYMKIAFYFDIDDNNNEFVKIFQGRYEGIYRGTYKIVEIEVLNVY